MTPILGNIAVDLFVKGGPIMWPILFCFIAALVVVIERAIWWWKLSRETRADVQSEAFAAISAGDFSTALKLVAKGEDPFLRTVKDGILHAHTSFLGAMQLRASDELERAEKRQWVLSTFITLAPLLGLLGTVAGIMHSFNVQPCASLIVTVFLFIFVFIYPVPYCSFNSNTSKLLQNYVVLFRLRNYKYVAAFQLVLVNRKE